MSKVKIAGTWAGVLEVELENWTVPMLRQEVARRSNCGPDSINLICAGKILKDGDGTEKLGQLGIKNNAKILASRVCAEEGKSLMAEEERSSRLARVKAAAAAMSKRHADGSLAFEDQVIELEDQSGRQVKLGSETDQRAIMMGLMLHTNAKQLMKKENYKDALEVLTMGEEAFSLCDPKVIEFIDNPPIMQIEIVWCYFMLRDISWLSVAGERLQKARQDFERSHGKDSSRVRLLQGARYPELALYLRLELLEGVVAYHSGQFDKSRKVLTSAQEKFIQLQVPDEALSLVMSMGFREHDAKRALRMSNQDVGSAIDFLVEEKARRAQKREEDLRRQKEIVEQRKYGRTPLKKAVDLQKLSELVSIGFEKDLAAEALRRNENDTQKALDDLTNPEINSSIQLTIESRKRKREQQAAEASIETLVRMGFERSRVIEAVQAGGTMEEITHQLLSQSASNPADSANNNTGSGPIPTDAIASSSVPFLDNLGEEDGGPSTAGEEECDAEMEDEIADGLANIDAMSDYDIEATKEGEAINEYLALLDSAGK
ncbi:Translation elongation factor [Parasponia andersonii]|uniref:Translation elongation factor n=1 Tax=Parasponia andersonii TaxID=3476 RepID=A0A2P5D5E5_PARAD|nr:Translation elongation factor [Parasponia andersonii]